MDMAVKMGVSYGRCRGIWWRIWKYYEKGVGVYGRRYVSLGAHIYMHKNEYSCHIRGHYVCVEGRFPGRIWTLWLLCMVC